MYVYLLNWPLPQWGFSGPIQANWEQTTQLNKIFLNLNWQVAVKDLNLGQLRTNPVSGKIKGLNPGPPDYKPSAQAS